MKKPFKARLASSVVVQHHLLAESQKFIQVLREDIDSDWQLQGLVVVNRDIAKADHAFHLVGD